jgi:hypothetical protein
VRDELEVLPRPLDFDHNLILHQQINSITPVRLFAVINYGQAWLRTLDPVFGVRGKDRLDKCSPSILVPEKNVPS